MAFFPVGKVTVIATAPFHRKLSTPLTLLPGALDLLRKKTLNSGELRELKEGKWVNPAL